MRDIVEKFNNRLAWICGFVGCSWAVVAVITICVPNRDIWSIAIFNGIMASLYGGYLYAKLDKWFNEEKKKYEQIHSK